MSILRSGQLDGKVERKMTSRCKELGTLFGVTQIVSRILVSMGLACDIDKFVTKDISSEGFAALWLDGTKEKSTYEGARCG
jgi:hypothetical protein